MWKLRDIVVAAILAVVCGVVYAGWDLITKVPLNIWPPVYQGLLNGVWWIAAGLVPYVVRRRGSAIVAELVSAFAEFVVNAGAYGPSGLLSGLLQGIGAEFGFALFKWRRYNIWTMMLSGALAGVGFSIQYYFQYGGNQLAAITMLGYLLTTMLSGALFGGALPKLIGDALKRTGVLRNFEISKMSGANVR